MTINIPDREGFINNFLKPISRFTEPAIFNVHGSLVTCLVSSIDNTTILYGEYNTGELAKTNETANIPNIDKLISALKLVNSDSIELINNSNNMQYKSENMNFKFHTYEDGILALPKLNVAKIKEFEYDTTFNMPASTVTQLIKRSTFASESNKVYFYSRDSKITAELTDRTTDNSDVFSFVVAEEFEGNDITEPIPLMLDSARSFSALNADVNVHINNEFGVVKFEISTNQSKLMYIVTSIVA